MGHDMNPIWLATQVTHLYMATIIGIISKRGFGIEASYRNQTNNS